MTTATSLIPEALRSDGKISAYGSARSTIKGTPLSPEELRKVDAYWRASSASPATARREDPVRKRGGPRKAGSEHRASVRPHRSRVRSPLHAEQTGDLQLPLISM
jgi:hypothetical protein